MCIVGLILGFEKFNCVIGLVNIHNGYYKHEIIVKYNGEEIKSKL